MKFKQEELNITNLSFKTDIDSTIEDDSNIQLEVGNIKNSDGEEEVIVFIKTLANYKDDKFILSASFDGRFILVDKKLDDIKNDDDTQEKLGLIILEKVYNKLNMYVSLLSQEVYNIPVYPQKVAIEVKQKTYPEQE
ncbi:hypothetical protein ACOXU5_13715 [Vagococcus fluvialis]|uniref:hypothetical protein n=1 Tax=Vagococcus fluvialis TaxID=2738 RepID=UPI003B5A742C